MGWRRKKKTTASDAKPVTEAAPAQPRSVEIAQPAPEIVVEESAGMGRSFIVAGPSRRLIDLRADAPGWSRGYCGRS
jgi:hypothetical protein